MYVGNRDFNQRDHDLTLPNMAEIVKDAVGKKTSNFSHSFTDVLLVNPLTPNAL
jgi:hypothetical protein